jgi:hypothetical protein
MEPFLSGRQFLLADALTRRFSPRFAEVIPRRFRWLPIALTALLLAPATGCIRPRYRWSQRTCQVSCNRVYSRQDLPLMHIGVFPGRTAQGERRSNAETGVACGFWALPPHPAPDLVCETRSGARVRRQRRTTGLPETPGAPFAGRVWRSPALNDAGRSATVFVPGDARRCHLSCHRQAGAGKTDILIVEFR